MVRLIVVAMVLGGLSSPPWQGSRVGLSLIVTASEAEALEVREQALEGTLSFGALAREHSIDPSSANGGYMGQVEPGELRDEFRLAVEGLGPGEISSVTPVGQVFVLLRVSGPGEDQWRSATERGLAALGAAREAEAGEALAEALALAEPFGDDRLATSLHNLGVFYVRTEDYEAARPLYERALTFLEDRLGPDHPEVAATLDNLASVREFLGDYTEAAALYERALEVTIAALGEADPNVAATLNNLAGLRQRQGDYPEARRLYARALSILEDRLGEDHPSTMSVAVDLSKFPTFPEFSCTGEMTFCNDAVAVGLGEDLRYGRGAAWVDLDGDGWDDLFLADSDNRWDPDDYGMSMFFVNQQDGTFLPRTAPSMGIDPGDLVSTWNGSFADYDNDGDPDLLLANGGYSGVSNLAFYENRIASGDGFVDATDASGIGVANQAPSHWWGTSWADYDGDGWLDVVVTRTEGRALLFHNGGDGTFTQVAGSLGVGVAMQDGKNPVWIDYDDDLDPDLYLAGMWEHAFYRNDGDGFTDITSEIFSTPLPYPDLWPFSSDPSLDPFVFSAAAADFDQNGFDDLYLGRWDIQDVLLLNDGAGGFRQHSTDWGLETAQDVTTDWVETTPTAESSERYLAFENTMGLGVGDLFDDGFPDVLIGTGSPPKTGSEIVLCNEAGGGFSRCTEEILLAGAEGEWRTRGHGTVFSDFDHDGDSDMLVNLGGHPDFDVEVGRVSPERAAFFVNRAGPAGNTAVVTLVGTRSNRDAIGARLRVGVEGPRYYFVRSMQAFQSQNSRTQILSLDAQDSAEVEIRWPSGAVQTIRVSEGERITVTEP